ncbi:MAG TPA: SUMF1/EgtB/PvdO family nonheme iron enzyme [Polyangiaceae bacterium]|nr:SUMF1/EgtB/PvdO family nonheme iron enzyme [Polyangiaceae bacterium]
MTRSSFPRPTSGVRRAERRRAAPLPFALLCLPLAGACSGEAFELAPGVTAAQGGDGLGGNAFRDNLDGGLGGSSSGAGGSAGSAGAGGTRSGPPAPDPSACGELRSGASSDDGEICVEAGSFSMGDSQVSTPNGYAAHGPIHTVTLSSAFVLDAKEVTVARYRACVVANVCAPPSTETAQGCTYTSASTEQDRLPVTCVSWNDAQIYCGWDGGRRLPTEAEWERAARGPTGTTYAWGDDVSCLNAVWGGLVQCPEHGGFIPKPVGSAVRGASREGAFDLTGNAWEWVNDWFGPYPSTPVTDPAGPNNGATRVLRGGNWQTPPTQSAAFMRRVEDPASTGPTSFRCARSVQAAP